MLLCDFLQVLRPVVIKSNLLFTETIKPIRNRSNARLESLLVTIIILISSLNDLFMMICILNLNFTDQFVSWSLLSSSGWLPLGCRIVRVYYKYILKRFLTFEVLEGVKESGKIDLKDRGSETWPLSCRSLAKILLLGLSCQNLDVLMLLFNDFITWKHN